MRTLFIERLEIVLFSAFCAANKSGHEWHLRKRSMFKDWHSTLRKVVSSDIAISRKKITAKTTLAWIAEHDDERHEPRLNQHGQLILNSTQQFLANYMSKICEVEVNLPDFVGNFIYEDLVGLAIRLKVNSRELRLLFPQINQLAKYLNPMTNVRNSYNSYSKESPNISSIYSHLTNNRFYGYRCKTFGDTIFRCSLDFSIDEINRLTCTWDVGNGAIYSGTAYVSDRAIAASLARFDGKSDFEMTFLCIDYDLRTTEWSGIFLGLTDGGCDPCSGRIIIVSDPYATPKKSGPVLPDEWSQDQKNRFLTYVSVFSSAHNSSSAIISDLNHLARCSGERKGIIQSL